MSSINVTFSRTLLAEILKVVRKHFPEIKVSKEAYVMNVGRDHWEFHGPDKYYNGTISATNAYEARYEGWSAWLHSKGIADEDDYADANEPARVGSIPAVAPD